MTEIRIRHEMADGAAVLGDLPLPDVSDAIQALKYHGLWDDEGPVGESRLSGGFRYDAELAEAYFEIEIAVSDD